MYLSVAALPQSPLKVKISQAELQPDQGSQQLREKIPTKYSEQWHLLHAKLVPGCSVFAVALSVSWWCGCHLNAEQ